MERDASLAAIRARLEGYGLGRIGSDDVAAVMKKTWPDGCAEEGIHFDAQVCIAIEIVLDGEKNEMKPRKVAK